MQNNQSSYHFWTWIVATLLALILLWMLFTGRGPSSACCGVTATVPVEAAAPVVAPIVEAEPFGFNASCQEVTATGDTSAVTWFAQADNLKSTLCTADGITASGNAQNIVLSGTVDSEATKTKLAEDAQAFFGSDMTIDNQIMVNVPEPVVVIEPPAAAKLYFATASVVQPADSAEVLGPIIAWLNEHPDAKAVVSGYHDPTGSKARNEKLAKARAQSTYDALIAAGIDADRVEMRKPQQTEGGGSLDEARRVEVSIE